MLLHQLSFFYSPVTGLLCLRRPKTTFYRKFSLESFKDFILLFSDEVSVTSSVIFILWVLDTSTEKRDRKSPRGSKENSLQRVIFNRRRNINSYKGQTTKSFGRAFSKARGWRAEPPKCEALIRHGFETIFNQGVALWRPYFTN